LYLLIILYGILGFLRMYSVMLY